MGDWRNLRPADRAKKSPPEYDVEVLYNRAENEADIRVLPVKHCDVVQMQIGFRYDEKERQNGQNTHFKTVVGKTSDGRNRWAEVYWRELSFPLIDNRITHRDVKLWSESAGIEFPPDSNCVGCFWKQVQQLRKNWDEEPAKMAWFSGREIATSHKFKKEMSYEQVKSLGLQMDFIFGGGSGCQAGFCTD